jgi:tetratricopeptide (TPR) repeat protein
MTYSDLEQLTRAEELFDAGKLDEALEILNDERYFEGLNLQQKSHFQFLKGLILFYNNKCEDLINLGKKMYEEGQNRNDILQSFDGLWFIITGLALFNKHDEAFRLIKKIEILINNISNVSKDVLTLRKLRLSTIKAYIGLRTGNADSTEKCLEWILNSQEVFEKTFELVWANAIMAQNLGTIRNDYDLFKKYSKKALSLAKEIRFNHYWIGICQLLLGVCYIMVGELDKSLKYYLKSLKLFKKIKSSYNIAMVLNNIGILYGEKGDYDLALQSLEECITLHNREQVPLGEFGDIEGHISTMISLAVEYGDIERAKKYFHNLEEIYKQKKDDAPNQRLKSKFYDLDLEFNFNKALMLKNSSRIRDKAKAQKLFKKIIDTTFFDVNIKAHIHLCDILLTEYNIENSVEVFNELNYYISSLLDIAEKQHSYIVFCETFLLQAKLALLNFNMKAARRYLTQAQKIAENYGIKRLAKKISHEHDELLRQLNIWENLKESKAPLADRLKFAGLNEQMENMVKRKMVEPPKLLDEEPVLLLIVSEGGVPFFTQSFIKDKTFEDHLLGGFFTAINSFIHEMFSEGFNRAAFGKHTLLMNTVSPFLVFYIYKGQSYSAQNRIKSFINEIKSHKEVWDKFEKFYQTNRKIQINDIPPLKPLIKEIFLEKVLQ